MIPVEKLSPVRRYLEENFPEFDVTDYFDSDSMTHVFNLQAESKRIGIRRAFLEDKSIQEIQTFLESSRIAGFLRNVESVSILVNEHGSIVVAKR
jgi:hypothetical protein